MGDVFFGDLYFIKWNGLVDLKLMNMMGYDVMIFGNYEFDKGLIVFFDFFSGNSIIVDLVNYYYFEVFEFLIVSVNVDVLNEFKLILFVKKL